MTFKITQRTILRQNYGTQNGKVKKKKRKERKKEEKTKKRRKKRDANMVSFGDQCNHSWSKKVWKGSQCLVNFY